MESNTFFFRDLEHPSHVTWDCLISDIGKSVKYNPYCRSSNYYDVFKHIILSMLMGKEIILLDSDFTESELLKLTGYSAYEIFTQPFNRNVLNKPCNKKEFIELLRKTAGTWKVTMYTSGTTGLPKKISHTFESITRFVKINTDDSNTTWGFNFNPTHIAGIQVFLQALLNGNSIVRLFGLPLSNIENEIRNQCITHISSTPTFYRLLSSTSSTFKSVRRITSGGERLNEKTLDELVRIFPNAKINNIYASTEAGTIFASENDVFHIKPELGNYVQIENNELLIHKYLIGDLEDEIGEWYNTGDLVEIISVDPLSFRFISRNGDIINVGGYKVNPIDVENALLSMDGIKEARVYGKKNSVLGNTICSDVILANTQITETDIRIFLTSKIQEYKIPRVINFVDYLNTTRTGKIQRY